MLSQSSPSLNRFPGLTLKAWALISGGVVVKGFNVDSVVAESLSRRIYFVTALGGGGGAVDAVAQRDVSMWGVIAANGASVLVSARAIESGAYELPGGEFFVAVYQ